MNRRFGLRRAVALAGIALQLALPAAATVADARLEAESARAHAHVESHATAACPRLHPDNCPVCQYLSTIADPGRRVALALPDCSTTRSFPFESFKPAAAARIGALARAPPSVV